MKLGVLAGMWQGSPGGKGAMADDGGLMESEDDSNFMVPHLVGEDIIILVSKYNSPKNRWNHLG